MTPSSRISDIEPCCPSDRPANSWWKYSRLSAMISAPANEPSGFEIRRDSAMLSAPARSRERTDR
jgi:hypothetical protein